MFRRCFILICGLIAGSLWAASASIASPRQNAAKNSGKASAPDYSQEPFVVEQFYTTVKFENDGTGERDQAVRIRVQSDAGVSQLGELVFGYNSANEAIDVHYVRVHKPSGEIVAAGPDAVKELTSTVARDAPVYTDTKEKHITVPSLHSGDTLEYEIVTRVITPFAPGEFWYEQNFIEDAIVLDERLEVSLPAARKITLLSPDFSPEKSSEGGRSIYRWKHTCLAHASDDDDSKKKPENAKQKPPAVELTTFASWKEVAEWYAKLEAGRTEPTPEIKAKADQIIQGKTTDLEKMEAIYEYVSTNVRYVSLSFGLSRYQPHMAGEVFANQYGDCKDKHTLLAAMLAAAGIPSDAALIPSSRKLDESVPSPSQFDHVITAVPEGSELVWMDSTAEVAPFRLLVAPLRNKSALLIPAGGDGKIVTTPADPPFLSTQKVESSGQVSELGKLTMKVHYTLRGDNEFVLRAAFRRTPQTQWRQLAQTIAAFDGIRGQVTSVKPSDPAGIKNPFELEIEYTEANFLDWSGKKAKIAPPLLTIGLPQVPEDNAEEIKLGSPLDVQLTLKLSLPANYSAQSPVAISVSRDYAEFKSSYQFADHTLTAGRSLKFKMRELPASRSGDYEAFQRAVESDESQVLLVENATPGPPTIPATAKSSELFEAGAAALNSGNPKAAIPLFQRVVDLDPKSKDAWNDLGLSYLRLGQFNEAATAFHKQIEVNPYDEHAFDYLGISYQQQRKYPEAIDAYHKQIEVNPLDPIAHAALGGLFMEQHKYSDAIPELEKATILAPDNAALQVSLGQAYLNTGEKEKALAAFEKGAEQSQTPLVWNNVAYALADRQIELDKALQYAQSAVAAVAANLRNIELSHVTIEDFGAVQSLGAYWDTLGWVYFQKGDLRDALPYIRSAWLLNQHGEVADHLAQIYEKQGEKEEAIHMFALAIAADHAVPETRTRLAALLGVDATSPKIEKLTTDAGLELTQLRTLPAGKLLDEKAEADFLVLVSPGDRTAKVEGAQFIDGSPKLRPFTDRLRSLDYGPVFPDDSPAKLVRRATLICATPGSACTLRLILPEDVRTVN